MKGNLGSRWPTARGSGSLHLGFQWDAASWSSVATIWDDLFSWLGSRPVCWNLPAVPVEIPAKRRSSLLAPLRARVESAGDQVAAMGFSGAPHLLLNLDELKREIAWGLRNPWATGLSDLFGLRPRLLVPTAADLRRGEAWRIYRSEGFRLVGVFHEVGGRPRGAGEGCLPCLRLEARGWAPGKRVARDLLRTAPRSPACLVVLDLSGPPDPRLLKSLLEEAGRLFGSGSLSVVAEPAIDLPDRAGDPLAAPSLAPSDLPGLQAALDRTAPLSRKRRKRTTEFASLLRALASPGGPGEPSPRESPSSNEERRLHAHMLGEVSLSGSSFDVRLRGGRFCGIVRHGVDVTPARPARSWVRAGASTTSLRTVSSVSFERDHGTGLLEELAADGPGAGATGAPRIRVEYSFLDGEPRLSIAMEVVVPARAAGARLEEYAPLVLALRRLRRNEPARIEVAAPDGSTSSLEVLAGCGWMPAPGAQHRIRREDGGWVALDFSLPAGRSWGLPSFRVCRSARERLLEVNLFGSWAPFAADGLARGPNRFSVRLGLD